MTDSPRAGQPPAGKPLVEVHDVAFFHGTAPVLRDVTLELRPGRHYVVAGPNGAGKSTLLDLLANLKRPRSGEVVLAGQESGKRSPREAARIVALAPQEFRLDFPFTVREIVAMGRRPHLNRWGRLGEEDVRAVERAIGELDLGAVAGRSVMALSGGEKRRCIIARAIAQATPALLLDEPDSGLDISHALPVMALARRLAEEGALVVTVSHDLNLSARFGHEIVFLRKGRLVAQGPVDAVFTDEILSRVYDADARVGLDAFTGAPVASFKIASGLNKDA